MIVVAQEPVNVRMIMILACIPIVSMFAFRRIEKFWFAAGLNLPFVIASDYIEKFVSNSDVDPILIVAIGLSILGADIFVLVYFARRWSTAWNKKFTNSNDSHKPQEPL